MTNLPKIFQNNEDQLKFEKIVSLIKKYKLPVCPRCETPIVNAVDSITGEISPYLFKPDCDCFPSGLQVCMG